MIYSNKNSSNKNMSKITVSKIGRVKILVYENFERINTTYKAAGIYKQLSPMNLGPFQIKDEISTNIESIINGKKVIQPILEYYPDEILPGYEFQNNLQVVRYECLEAYWQSRKIYSCDIDENNIVKKSFYERMKFGTTANLQITSPKDLRRTFPKSTHGVPVLSFYNNEFMDWITSRVKVYCPIYSDLVKETEAYKVLENKIQNNVNIQFLDPDGYDYGILDEEKIRNALYSTERPFCHSMVLAACLLNLEIW